MVGWSRVHRGKSRESTAERSISNNNAVSKLRVSVKFPPGQCGRGDQKNRALLARSFNYFAYNSGDVLVRQRVSPELPHRIQSSILLNPKTALADPKTALLEPMNRLPVDFVTGNPMP